MLWIASVALAASMAVSVDDSEAQAAIAILAAERAARKPSASEWSQLFQSPGYVRLKQREAAIKRPFTDDDFRAFLEKPDVSDSAPQLAATLATWRKEDLTSMEARASAYLPVGASLHATIFLLVKPRTNSFVFQLDTDPAIMLYLNPAVTADQFANTVSHELLHVGDSENCPSQAVQDAEKAFNPEQKAFNEWLSAFGEGWAVLAAAGGPTVDPHWEDPQHDRDLWNSQMAHFDSDFSDLQSFFTAVSSGTLSGDAIPAQGMTYFGDYQGPWYTVGYRMDTTIEQQLGRPALIAALCDKRSYLATYNNAAKKYNEVSQQHLPLWNDSLAAFLH